MRVLLTAINSKYTHSNLAVYSLKAYAAEYAEHIEIAEFTINQYPDYILKEIYKKKPDVIAFSCYIWNLEYIERLLADLKKILPDIPVWLGGPEVSYDGEAFLSSHPQADGIMVGEGERSFRALVEYYLTGNEKLQNIQGIIYREGGDIQINDPGALLDMDTIPFPYNDLKDFENRIVYYESSRGCPFSCSYCLSSVEKQVRFRSPRLVKAELQFFLDHKTAQVKFVDRTFNCSHSHAWEIWNYIKEHDNGVTNFHFEVSADLLTGSEIELLGSMRPGLIQLEIGVQSTNRQVIREIRRTMNYPKLTEAVGDIQKGNNIHQHLDLIAGLPLEDYQMFRDSFNHVYRLRPQQLQLGFLKVLKGSYMEEHAAEYGLVYSSKPPYEVLHTNWISYEELLQLKAVEEMVEVYYNSGQFRNTMEYLTALYETPFQAYADLAEYYEEQGLFQISHTRIRRYEIIREFGGARRKGRLRTAVQQQLEELLIYDLYLRENLRNRPAWAALLQDDEKQAVRRFYQEEEEMHTCLSGYESYRARQMSKMTHIEKFHFSAEEMNFEDDNEWWILFDYQKRNPLTYEAAVYSLQLDSGETGKGRLRRIDGKE